MTKTVGGQGELIESKTLREDVTNQEPPTATSELGDVGRIISPHVTD